MQPRFSPRDEGIALMLSFAFSGLAVVECCILIVLILLLAPVRTEWADWLSIRLWSTILMALSVGFWRPKWVKPHWINWLEENYSDRLGTLVTSARGSGLEGWEKRVATQEGLERWARGVAGAPNPKFQETQEKLNYSMVYAAISGRARDKTFSLSELKSDRPSLSRKEIRRALKQLKAEGIIARVGLTRWICRESRPGNLV